MSRVRSLAILPDNRAGYPRSQERKVTSEYDLRHVKVAIVDDSLFMTELIRYMLEHLGCRDIHAANDTGTLMHELDDCADQDPSLIPDIIISDWAMKPNTGLEFIMWLRRHRQPILHYTPFIMLSAYSTRDHVIAARNAGANEFLTKPLSTQTLVQRLSRIIENPQPFVRAPAYFGPDRRRRVIARDISHERRQPRSDRKSVV